MYMLIAATIFHGYDKEVRLDYVRRYYDQSRHPSTLDSIMWALGHLSVSCWQVLVETDDSLDSIFSSTPIGYYTVEQVLVSTPVVSRR